MNEFVIIVAGGSGSRMQSETPKQFIEIEGKPIIFYTIEAFFKYSPDIEIILVLPESQIDEWENLRKKHFRTDKKITVCSGGKSRFQSVKKGLNCIKTNGWVAIHDGVRPLIKPRHIGEAFAVARQKGNAIIVTPLKESIREIIGDRTESRDRSKYFLIQTPQIFQVDEIKRAYEIGELSHLTDDASVAEHFGVSINVVVGDYDNIKITTPEDLLIARSLLKRKNEG